MRRALVEGAALAALASGLAAAWYLAFGDVDLNLADEGFLWHGVQRTLAGEVPKRDFQAYDPGRYYVCAAWCALFGDGILALRASLAAVQAAGTFFGLLVLRRVVAPAALVPFGAVLVAWMFPQHKVFEPAYAMLAVWAGVRLCERPSVARYVAAGLVVGLGGCIGVNLALYGGVGLGAVALYRALKPAPAGDTRAREARADAAGEEAAAGTTVGAAGLARGLAAFGGGVVLGYAPVLALCAFVPGYAAAFADSLAGIARAGTNVPLPYPWPWRFELGGLTGWALANRVAVAAAFVLPAVAYPLGLWIAVRTRGPDVARRAVPIAAALVGVVFVHHVSVRSDPPHLAQVLHPALILVVAAPAVLGAPRARRVAGVVVGTLVVVVSALAVHDAHPSLVGLHAWRPDVTLRPLRVAGDTLRLPSWTHGLVRHFLLVTEAHVPADAPMLIAPYAPTLYPASGRRSPVYTSYFLFPAEPDDERAMIEELTREGVDWAWITGGGMDGDRERAFDRTHPLLWQHVAERFEVVRDARVPAGTFLLRRR